MRLVEDGIDPMNTFRDPAENEIIFTFDEHRAPGERRLKGRRRIGGAFQALPMSGEKDPDTGKLVRSPTGKYGPIARTAEEIFARAAGR